MKEKSKADNFSKIHCHTYETIFTKYLTNEYLSAAHAVKTNTGNATDAIIGKFCSHETEEHKKELRN